MWCMLCVYVWQIYDAANHRLGHKNVKAINDKALMQIFCHCCLSNKNVKTLSFFSVINLMVSFYFSEIVNTMCEVCDNQLCMCFPFTLKTFPVQTAHVSIVINQRVCDIYVWSQWSLYFVTKGSEYKRTGRTRNQLRNWFHYI